MPQDLVTLLALQERDLPKLFLLDFERQASFFMTGGLVAAHAAGRDRDAICDAWQRREVYGTSGPRLLLWFDLLNGPEGTAPMGSQVAFAGTPRFRVRAVGEQEQKPGCPERSLEALGKDRLELLCRGECFNPGDRRRLITHVDVVRVRPQVRPGEPVRPLIDDPWRRFECPRNEAGCVIEFDDPEFASSGRENIYYVHAVQEPTPAVNANPLRCEYDDKGQCVRVHPERGLHSDPPARHQGGHGAPTPRNPHSGVGCTGRRMPVLAVGPNAGRDRGGVRRRVGIAACALPVNKST